MLRTCEHTQRSANQLHRAAQQDIEMKIDVVDAEIGDVTGDHHTGVAHQNVKIITPFARMILLAQIEGAVADQKRSQPTAVVRPTDVGGGPLGKFGRTVHGDYVKAPPGKTAGHFGSDTRSGAGDECGELRVIAGCFL